MAMAAIHYTKYEFRHSRQPLSCKSCRMRKCTLLLSSVFLELTLSGTYRGNRPRQVVVSNHTRYTRLNKTDIYRRNVATYCQTRVRSGANEKVQILEKIPTKRNIWLQRIDVDTAEDEPFTICRYVQSPLTLRHKFCIVLTHPAKLCGEPDRVRYVRGVW